jgi:hypothetical protein
MAVTSAGTSADALAHGMVVIESDEDAGDDVFWASLGAQENTMRDEESVASGCQGVSMRQRWEDDF